MWYPASMQKLARIAFIAPLVLLVFVGAVWGARLIALHTSQATAQSAAINVGNGGFPMTGTLAPDFTLTDQFGQNVTLSSLGGHEVVMAFIDSKCTTICPLTAETILHAKNQLGASAASRVELVAVNANPVAASIADVRAWSAKNGLLHQWLFLTGTAQQLQSVYHAYNVYDQVTGTQVAHDPAVFIIDAKGHERLYFETLNSNSQTDISNEESGLVAGMEQWLPQ